MTRQIYGLLGVMAIAAFGAACKSDPIADNGGSPSRLDLEFAYREVIIGDSVRTFAIERDALNTPLPPTATVRSCAPAVATVATVSDAPQQRTGFYVKGLTYGTTCVVAEAGLFSDSMQVATFPARLLITSGPDTVVSGTTGAYTFQYVDRGGAGVAGVPAATWSVADTTFGVVNPAGGVLAGRDSGLVTLKVNGVGSPPEGLSAQRGVLVVPAPFNPTIVPNPADPGQVVNFVRNAAGPTFDADTRILFGATVQLIVAGSLTPDSAKVAVPDLAANGALGVRIGRFGPQQITQRGGVFTVNTPAAFTGTATPSSGVPTDTVKLKRTSGPLFDANTRAYFAGIRTFIALQAADSILAIVPGIGSTGGKELRVTRMDAADFARKVTFTSNDSSFADHYDAVNDDPATAPALTTNGDYFVIEHGTCTDGVVTAPGDDCDDFFAVTNPGGVEDTLSVRADWFDAADVDILWCKNATCSGPGNVVTGGGATAANPENSTVRIPAGATWYLWINYFAKGGASTIIRVRLTNKN